MIRLRLDRSTLTVIDFSSTHLDRFVFTWLVNKKRKFCSWSVLKSALHNFFSCFSVFVKYNWKQFWNLICQIWASAFSPILFIKNRINIASMGIYLLRISQHFSTYLIIHLICWFISLMRMTRNTSAKLSWHLINDCNQFSIPWTLSAV